MKPCEYRIDANTRCGQPATCVIKISEGKLSIKNEDGDDIGRGVGSFYAPICDLHKSCYPDHDGFELEPAR